MTAVRDNGLAAATPKTLEDLHTYIRDRVPLTMIGAADWAPVAKGVCYQMLPGSLHRRPHLLHKFLTHLFLTHLSAQCGTRALPW